MTSTEAKQEPVDTDGYERFILNVSRNAPS